ncbi:hypothetical protein J2Y02_002668 [Neobacillus drentensis]|nr:hypothetical protein [Neobacillus drentensis]
MNKGMITHVAAKKNSSIFKNGYKRGWTPILIGIGIQPLSLLY